MTQLLDDADLMGNEQVCIDFFSEPHTKKNCHVTIIQVGCRRPAHLQGYQRMQDVVSDRTSPQGQAVMGS